MSAFRDSTASLVQRIQFLERENARLRSERASNVRASVNRALQLLAQLIGVIAFIAVALVASLLVVGILCLLAVSIAHA